MDQAKLPRTPLSVTPLIHGQHSSPFRPVQPSPVWCVDGCGWVGACLAPHQSLQSVSFPRRPPTHPHDDRVRSVAFQPEIPLSLVLSPPAHPHPFDARPAAGRSLVGPDWINIICSPPIFSPALVSISHRASFAYPLHAIIESVHSRSCTAGLLPPGSLPGRCLLVPTHLPTLFSPPCIVYAG